MNWSKLFFQPVFYLLLVLLVGLASGCNVTKHVGDNEYILRKNKLDIDIKGSPISKSDLKDQVALQLLQKPNTYLFGVFPYKVWLYNLKYNKIQKDSTHINGAEKPVIYDSVAREKTISAISNFLFYKGYFYSNVMATTRFKRKKAIVTYNIDTRSNYTINNINLDIDDSEVDSIVRDKLPETALKKGLDYTYDYIDLERNRITKLMRSNGYYRFSQENIAFELDTVDKKTLKNSGNIFESATDFLTQQQTSRKAIINIKITIRNSDDSLAYRKYTVGQVTVFPDFVGREDVNDSTMLEKNINKIKFRYHDYYVHENVIAKHIYLTQGDVYSQDNYDFTISKLNDLGIFQYVRLYLLEDTTVADKKNGVIRCIILLNPTKKFDFITNLEVSNGTGIYALGSSVSVGIRDRNLFKGANQFSLTVTGGVELNYSPKSSDNVFLSFSQRATNFGITGNLIMPKFLAPVNQQKISNRNLPRTIISLGTSLLNRKQYFEMYSTQGSLTYNWLETNTKTWDFTPLMVNVVTLPYKDPLFQARLDTVSFLKNTYKNVFIEGESVFFTFSNQNKYANQNSYMYLKVGGEEAGAVLTGINSLVKLADKNGLNVNYAHYIKFDFDGRYYHKIRKSLAAFRLYAGVGIPYDTSATIPYIKQYFAGGPYSNRGFRIRTLGPGASLPDTSSQSYIDRTGEIKLEANAEYRFPVAHLSAIQLNGALFTDAGNVWLAGPSTAYPNGEFNLSKLAQQIAISMGTGLRLDIGGGFFTVRFDAGIPVKKPWVNENGGWVFNKIDIWNKQWRDDNLVFSIAIGYPF